MSHHAIALEDGSVLNIDAVFHKDKIKHPVRIAIRMKHNEKHRAGVRRGVEGHAHVLVRAALDKCVARDPVAIGFAVDKRVEHQPTIAFNMDFAEGERRPIAAPDRAAASGDALFGVGAVG